MKFSTRTLAGVGAIIAGTLTLAFLPMSGALAVVAAPTNLAPDDANAWAKNVVLTWDAIPGANAYEVQMTNDGFSTDGKILSAITDSNRYAPPVALPRGDYQWRVRATLSTGNTGWSATAHLLRGWDPSVAPTLTALSGNTNDWSVNWNAIPDASYYEVEVSPIFSEGENPNVPPYSKATAFACVTTHTTWAPYTNDQPGEPDVAEGTNCSGSMAAAVNYAIRVRGRDGTVDDTTTPFPVPTSFCTGVWQSTVGSPTKGSVPECTGWSNEVSKTVFGSATEPSQVTGLATTDNSGSCDAGSSCTDVPVMSWNYDPNADYYRVYLSRDRSGTDYDRLYDNVYGTSFQMADTFTDRSLPWYWRVQACNTIDPDPADSSQQGQKCGPASDPSSFTMNNGKLPLAGASPTEPGPDIHTQYVDMTFANTVNGADHGAKAFEVQVSTDSNFASVSTDDVVDQQAGNSNKTTYRVDGLADGTYFWRYRAVDQLGKRSAWTQDSSLSFTIDAAVPTVSIATKSGFGSKDSVKLASTKALTGTNSNTLGVMLQGGAQVSGKLSQIDSKTWKFTPDGHWVAGAAYVPFVKPSVTATGSGIVAVGDNVARRPNGLIDSKSSLMKKVNGDFKWATRSASDAIGKSYVAAKHQSSNGNPPKILAHFGGKSVSLIACSSSASGLADIVIDGTKVDTVDLYKGVSSCGKVWSTSKLTDDVHTIEVLVVGRKSAKSSGTYVSVDAVKAG